MARLIGGIGTSHVPTIGGAYDRKKQDDPDWAPLFKGYEPVRAWLEEKRPDVLVFFYNDHASTFFFDHYPTFALGLSETFPIADEGLGPRAIPPLKGHPALARHMAESLVNDEFDISVWQDLPIDHGVHSPLTMFWPPSPDWPGKIVPIEINVLQHPIPTPLRCWKLGQAVRRALLSPAVGKIPQGYSLPMTTGMAVALFGEPAAKPVSRKARSARRPRRNGAQRAGTSA